ncbi:hypothetical protein [Botrimarina sp.]|uniref:hypothetical protein n=1 Tax=Botrimarina sp. TaxID=2795802 RepID=UPI0032EF0971
MLATLLFTFLPLAQAADEEAARQYNWSWAVILLSLVLGLMIACRPAKRELEVRKARKG